MELILQLLADILGQIHLCKCMGKVNRSSQIEVDPQAHLEAVR